MGGFIFSQLRFRPGRASALAAAIVVATASFSVLLAAGKTSEIRVRGSVKSNYRTAYDILVRPKGASLPLEREQGLVRDNYLSGLFGGITPMQYSQILRLPGVEVAAPIANIGYVIPSGYQGFRMNDLLSRDPVQLYRQVFTSVADAGTSRYPLGVSYVYYTRRHRFALTSGLGTDYGEVVPGRADPLGVCPGGFLNPNGPPSPFWTKLVSLACYSARSPGYGSDRGAPGEVQSGTGIFFPILLAAIDPVQEARLLHLDRTIVAGRYLREAEKPRLQNTEGNSYHRLVPVIASTRTYVDEHVDVRIERLSIRPGTNVAQTLATDALPFLSGLRGHKIARRTVSAQAMYRGALAGTFGRNGRSGQRNISWSYWTASPVRYRSFVHHELVPRVVKNPLSVWRRAPTPGDSGGYTAISQANADLQFRRLHPRIGSPFFSRTDVPGKEVLQTPLVFFVGRYDPERLPGFSPLSKVPLETYYPPELLPGDAASRRALHGRPLLPSTNIGDYVAQPPLFLTTLQGMQPFLNSKYYAGASPKAPISVIRVRVKGVTGPDQLSQARVRQVATEIHDRTGLQVDITAGSSPKRLIVKLPPGKYGRPALLLQEGWSKKGVSLSFLRALDRKRLGLLALILITCVFFLANGAFAAVRGRRREIGTLLCIGWSRKAIFSVVLAELVLVGTVAGLAAAAVAAIVARLFSLDLSLLSISLAIPLSVALATVAGIVPAWRAARTGALDAVRPAISTGAVRSHVGRLLSLAAINVRRVPARSTVASAGLFIASAALTLLLAINQAFQGHVVGTLLGDAVSVEVRGLDFLVVGVIVLLATLSLADVLYLNLRERAAEFVTLRTVGWSDRYLVQVVAIEAAILGLLGTIPGSLIALLIGLQLGVPVFPLLLASTISILGGLVVALLASLVPLAQLSALTAPSVLAEE
jgi:putative ABC transport system permease protein